MIHADLLHQLALTRVPQIGAVHAKILVEHFGNAENIFKARKRELSAIEHIGEVRAHNIKHFNGLEEAEKEIAFIRQYNIQPLFLTDAAYPKRLLHCYDAPTLLFYRGNANLNSTRVVSIIGTRTPTEYGKLITEKLVADLAAHQVLVVSGLAFGIDAVAHKAALHHHLPTIGVLAHGLQVLYPVQHKGLAREMTEQGGLLTEFTRAALPDKHHFPRRNRIVAGLADAVIVVETAIKGGSMITADLANGYHKEVFAFPGKITDHTSSGCNHLIKNHQAALLTNAQQLVEAMRWEQPPPLPALQKQLFTVLTQEEQLVLQFLQQKQPLHIDELCAASGLSNSAIATAILTLELQQVVKSLPGKRFSLLQ